MSIPDPLNPKISNARRLAPRFTPHTPFHHPHFDPNVPKENHHLVPPALFGGRKLNGELPRPAVVNLHVMLKLTNDPDELQKEFHDKIPQINDVLGLWSGVKGASPTTTGEAQLRSRAPFAEDGVRTSPEEGSGATFNLVSNLDTPGRADVIYLADASEDSVEYAEESSIPSNLRSMEWLGFDGSLVHLEDAEPKMAAATTEQGFDFNERSMRRSSTPFNLRITEWLDGEQSIDLPIEAYSSEADSGAENDSREIGPYENFWINHH